MILLNIADVSISQAIANDELVINEKLGRYGKVWEISDSQGLIEIALTKDECDGIIQNVIDKM